MSKIVAIVGTLDTKGTEYKFLHDQIESNGVKTFIIDAGVFGNPDFIPDISTVVIAEAAGTSLEKLRKADRGKSIEIICRGISKVVKKLYDEGKFHGIVSLGGTAGTTIGTTAMRSLPIGVPKLMVSTIASGNTKPYVDTKDIVMMPSIVDISGINRLSSIIITNAASAISGMVKAKIPEIASEKPLIGLTMFGVTTPCVTKAREVLEKEGYEALVFHATGIGGKTMEDLVRSDFIKGVLDVTTTELADELVGGILTAGPNRLEAAGEKGIPQIVVPGAIDMVNFGPPETVPKEFEGRTFYQHNPTVTLMRTTNDENAELGEIIGSKLNKAKGPVSVIIPKKGVSAYDVEGHPFYDPQADSVFIKSLKNTLNKEIDYIEMDNNINDEKFSNFIANKLLSYLK